MKTKSIGLGFQLEEHLVWKACEFIFGEPRSSEYEPLLPYLFEFCTSAAKFCSRFKATGIKSGEDSVPEDEVFSRCLHNYRRPAFVLLEHLVHYVDGMTEINYVLLRHRIIPRTRFQPKRDFESDDAEDQDIVDFIKGNYGRTESVTAVKKARARLAYAQWECFDACIWAVFTALGITSTAARGTVSAPVSCVKNCGKYLLLPPHGLPCLNWIGSFVKAHRPANNFIIWNGSPMKVSTSRLKEATAKTSVAGVVVWPDSGAFVYSGKKARSSTQCFDRLKSFGAPPADQLIVPVDYVFLVPQRQGKAKVPEHGPYTIVLQGDHAAWLIC